MGLILIELKCFFFQLLFIFLLWEESHQSKIKFKSTVVIASLAESKKKLTSRKEASTDCKLYDDIIVHAAASNLNWS